MKEVVNEKTAAEFLSVAVQTLRNQRCSNRGPNYIKLGRSVRYKKNDLEKYLNINKVKTKN